MVGELVGPYKIVRLLGEGGMGQVFEAEELGESGRVLRRAALKVLRPEHLGDAQMAARFVNEAKAIDVIDHPGVVTIYDIGTLPSGAPYIAMEFLDGESLRDRLRGRGVTRAEALQIGAKLASTLAVVHEKRIIHRDLKPENVMLCLRSSKQTPVVSALGSVSVTTALGDVKVLDFGIAKCLQNTAGDGQIKTRTGVMIGTPTYMAPEQCGGDGEVCERTDVYSLGVMLFEMLSGRPPFVGDHDAQIIGKQLFAVPPSLQTLCEGLEPQLAALVNRMLAKDIKSRPPMNEVEAELLVLRRSVQGSSEVQHSDTSATTVAMSQEPRNTLVDAAGHMQRPLRQRRMRLAMLGGGALLVLGALSVLGWQSGRGGSGGNVTWHIVTEPQGVEVVSEVSGQLLGRTPLTFAPQGLGAQAILLRQPGFLERRLLLDQGANTERSEVLVPAPSASQSAVAAVPAVSSSSKSAAKSGKSAGEAGKSHSGGSGSRRHGSRSAQ
jgi:serine/threonine protein kinase